jgi:hypothetical protein
MKTDPRLLLLALLAVILAAACSLRQSPGDVAVRYTLDLEEGNGHHAWALLADEDRARMPEALFAAGVLAPDQDVAVRLVETRVDGDEAQAVLRVTRGPSRKTIEDYHYTPKQIADDTYAAEETRWLKRQPDGWRVWEDFECQSRVKPLLREIDEALLRKDHAAVLAKAAEAVRLCPRSTQAQFLLKGPVKS